MDGADVLVFWDRRTLSVRSFLRSIGRTFCLYLSDFFRPTIVSSSGSAPDADPRPRWKCPVGLWLRPASIQFGLGGPLNGVRLLASLSRTAIETQSGSPRPFDNLNRTPASAWRMASKKVFDCFL